MKQRLLILLFTVIFALNATGAFATLDAIEEAEIRRRTRIEEEKRARVRREQDPNYIRQNIKNAEMFFKLGSQVLKEEEKKKAERQARMDAASWISIGMQSGKNDFRWYMANWAIPQGNFDAPGPYAEVKVFLVGKELGNENHQLHYEILVMVDKVNYSLAQYKPFKSVEFSDVTTGTVVMNEDLSKATWQKFPQNKEDATKVMRGIMQVLPHILEKRRFKEF